MFTIFNFKNNITCGARGVGGVKEVEHVAFMKEWGDVD